MNHSHNESKVKQAAANEETFQKKNVFREKYNSYNERRVIFYGYKNKTYTDQGRKYGAYFGRKNQKLIW